MVAGAFCAELNDEMLKRIAAGITDIGLVCSSVLFMQFSVGYSPILPLANCNDLYRRPPRIDECVYYADIGHDDQFARHYVFNAG